MDNESRRVFFRERVEVVHTEKQTVVPESCRARTLKYSFKYTGSRESIIAWKPFFSFLLL